MSAAEATLYGAIIAGTFTLLGVVVERLIQRYDRVRCVMEPIESYTAHGGDAEEMRPLRRLPVPADHLPAPDAGAYNDWNEPLVRCSIKAKMFNEKEARTGLRDVVLVFDGEPPLEQPLKDRSTRREGYGGIRIWTSWRPWTCLPGSGSCWTWRPSSTRRTRSRWQRASERGCGATTPTAGCSASGCPPRGRSGSGASFGPYSPNAGE